MRLVLALFLNDNERGRGGRVLGDPVLGIMLFYFSAGKNIF